MLKDALPYIKTVLPGPKAAAVLERRKKAIPGAITNVYPCVILKGEGYRLRTGPGGRRISSGTHRMGPGRKKTL